jgi:hypothetical protein
VCTAHTHTVETRMGRGKHCAASALVAVSALQRHSFGGSIWCYSRRFYAFWGIVLRMKTACQQLQLQALACAVSDCARAVAAMCGNRSGVHYTFNQNPQRSLRQAGIAVQMHRICCSALFFMSEAASSCIGCVVIIQDGIIYNTVVDVIRLCTCYVLYDLQAKF